ncbi:transposase [Flavobacterium psychroterrae]|uniref:ISAon1 family transposase N-terminal region protein n=1 Tax=Flavobacterium psychroterrae TaxID=2133767 RepID=UPI003622207E
MDLLKFMLPDFLVEHFEVVSTTNTEEVLHLYFEEKIQPPQEFNTFELVSKGFLDEITIQDFPLRGKFVYLHIKRRRWTNKTTGGIIKRDWTLVAKGTRMTHEFATFLKEINR